MIRRKEAIVMPSASRPPSTKLAEHVARAEQASVQGRFLRHHLLPSVRYLFRPEVHVYASSIAANALLSFFPFTLMLLTVSRRWLHWQQGYQAILQLVHVHLPAGADFVVRNLVVLVQGHRRLQAMSVFMLFFTSSGIFLPLEMALNKIWGFDECRSLVRNQVVGLSLATASAVLAFLLLLLTTTMQSMFRLPSATTPARGFNAVVSRGILEVVFVLCLIAIYLLTYYVLPNGQVPLRNVLAAAFMAALLTEIGKFVYLLSLPLLGFREVYGPFALSVTLLFWAFVGAMILLWGARLSAQVTLINYREGDECQAGHG